MSRKKLVIFALGALGVMLTAVEAGAQPKLEYPPNELRLGTVFNGASKTARVTLKNTGNQDLRITSVRTSCGCTTVRTPKETLKPGESDVVEVSFDATGFRGRVTKYISIETNDPQSAFISIPMTADVAEELIPSGHTSYLWFGSIPIGKPADQRVTFVNISNVPITITSTTSSVPDVAVRIPRKRIAPKDSVVCTVTAHPTREGYLSADIVLNTDSKKQSRVPLRVTYVATRP